MVSRSFGSNWPLWCQWVVRPQSVDLMQHMPFTTYCSFRVKMQVSERWLDWMNKEVRPPATIHPVGSSLATSSLISFSCSCHCDYPVHLMCRCHFDVLSRILSFFSLVFASPIGYRARKQAFEPWWPLMTREVSIFSTCKFDWQIFVMIVVRLFGYVGLSFYFHQQAWFHFGLFYSFFYISFLDSFTPFDLSTLHVNQIYFLFLLSLLFVESRCRHNIFASARCTRG